MEVIRAWGGNKDIGVPSEQKKKAFKELGNLRTVWGNLRKKEHIFVCPSHTGNNQTMTEMGGRRWEWRGRENQEEK